jgi:hypothetical protein
LLGFSDVTQILVGCQIVSFPIHPV